MKHLTVIIALAALTSCQTIKSPPPDQRTVEALCGLFFNISYDGKNDTAMTKEQIKQFNAKRDAFCK